MIKDLSLYKDTNIKSTTALEFNGLNLHSNLIGDFYLNKKQLLELLKDSKICNNESEYKFLINSFDKGLLKTLEGINPGNHKVILTNNTNYLYMNREVFIQIKSLISDLNTFASLSEVGDTVYFTEFGILLTNNNGANLLLHINTIDETIIVYNIYNEKYFQPQILFPKTDIKKTNITELIDIISMAQPIEFLFDSTKISIIRLRDILYYSKIIEANRSKNKFKPPYKLNIAKISDNNALEVFSYLTEKINENWNDPINRLTADANIDVATVLMLVRDYLISNTTYDIINLCEKMCSDIIPSLLRGIE